MPFFSSHISQPTPNLFSNNSSIIPILSEVFLCTRKKITMSHFSTMYIIMYSHTYFDGCTKIYIWYTYMTLIYKQINCQIYNFIYLLARFVYTIIWFLIMATAEKKYILLTKTIKWIGNIWQLYLKLDKDSGGMLMKCCTENVANKVDQLL